MDTIKKMGVVEWLAVAFGVLAAISMTGGLPSLSASPKVDPKDQAYAAGVYSWCLACEASPATPLVKPSPAGGVCDNCNGRGRVGDGTVMVTCAACDGTGRIGPSRPDDDDDDTGAAPEDQGSSPGQAPVQPLTSDEDDNGNSLDCSDGACGTVRTRRGIFGGFFRRR